MLAMGADDTLVMAWIKAQVATIALLETKSSEQCARYAMASGYVPAADELPVVQRELAALLHAYTDGKSKPASVIDAARRSASWRRSSSCREPPSRRKRSACCRA